MTERYRIVNGHPNRVRTDDTLRACYYCGAAAGELRRYPSPPLRPVFYHPPCYRAAEEAAAQELRAALPGSLGVALVLAVFFLV